MPAHTTHRPTRALAAVAAVVAIAVTGLAFAARPAGAASYSPRIPFPSACGTCVMNANEALTDGSWILKMQGDGNLVERNPTGTVCFASNTSGHTGAHVTYQGDGNFVVYSPGGTALWSSRTAGLWIGSGYSVSVHVGYFYVGDTLVHRPC